MWKADHTELGQAPGNLEMVTTSSSSGDEFDDEEDGVGFTMKNSGNLQTSRGRNSGLGKRLVCAFCMILAIVALVLTFVYAPDFGLVTGTSSDNDDNSDDPSPPKSVSPDSIVETEHFDIILQVPVPTVEGDLVVYQHKKTKTPVMTILPYDTNQDNVFGISFRTKPSNSHGAPHVLEHAVLSGSKKYPIKDPFTQMAKGSLNTYVNAMTFKDLTAYICASRNDADMKNLMSVYMDAVFQPLVIEDEGKWIFRQEGWRVEMNETGEPEFNGVVLSEMRGAYSDPSDVLDEYAMAELFPNTTYRFESGGHPKVIPQLSHRELQEFYHTFYHPSNAQVFLYGTKASAENCLTNLDEYLRNHEPRPDIRNQSKIELQPLLDMNPPNRRIPYASDNDEDTTHQFMMSWLISKDGTMDDAFQQEHRVAFSVLDELLMNDKTGVLYRALQDSGLGGRVSGGIDNSMQQWTFEVQVSNVNETNVPAVETLIRNTLQQVVDEGFHKEDIESAMNTVEFSNRDMSSFNHPRGIKLFLKVMRTWKFDLDPRTGFLSFEEDFQGLKKKVSKHGSNLFVEIVRDNVIECSHQVVIGMYPDAELAQKDMAEEQARLVKLRKSQAFPALLDEADDLAEKQVTKDSPDLLATIPSIAIGDLAKKGYEAPIKIVEDMDGSGVTVLVHEVESSFGISYVDLGVDISMLEFDDIVLVPLLAGLIVDAGTKKYNDIEIAREVGINTGGIRDDILISPILPANSTTRYRVPDGDHFHSKLFLMGSATTEKCEKLLELMSEIMFNARLDSQDRALGILRERISSMEQELTAGGTRFAASRLHARYHAYRFVNEELGGVSALPKLREILKTAESDWGSVLERLQKMQLAILNGNRNGMVLNLTGEKSVLKALAPHVSHFLEKLLPDRSQETSLPNFAADPHPWVTKAKELMATESPVANEGIATTTTVNFVGQGAPFYNALEELSGSVKVVAQYIEYNNFVLQIRERRGAYGAWASSDAWTGFLTYMTYRDPNFLETLEVYRAVPAFLKEQMDSPETFEALVNSAIIGTIGSLDGSAPQANLAGYTSMIQWLHGSTPKLRQAWREEILATGTQDFVDFAERLKSWEPTISVAGPKTALERQKGLNMTIMDLM